MAAAGGSGAPLAFTNPSSGKIDQQRKILEELERQKKLLSGSGSQGSASNSLLSDSGTGVMSSNQRSTALEAAAKTSFGYFIAQDSSFGNTILPVVPRPVSGTK